jgi:hypothetical protein
MRGSWRGSLDVGRDRPGVENHLPPRGQSDFGSLSKDFRRPSGRATLPFRVLPPAPGAAMAHMFAPSLAGTRDRDLIRLKALIEGA